MTKILPIQRLLELKQQGKSLRDIARMFGCSHGTIRNKLKGIKNVSQLIVTQSTSDDNIEGELITEEMIDKWDIDIPSEWSNPNFVRKEIEENIKKRIQMLVKANKEHNLSEMIDIADNLKETLDLYLGRLIKSTVKNYG